MAWIPVHQSLWTHRKTFILAAFLQTDETVAASHMIRLWTWSLDNAPEGDLLDLPVGAVAFGAGWRGDSEQFVQATIKAGFLEEIPQGWRIHDWMEYGGKRTQEREKDRNRKHQASSESTVQAATGTQSEIPEHSCGIPPEDHRNSDVDKIRKEEKIKEVQDQDTQEHLAKEDPSKIEKIKRSSRSAKNADADPRVSQVIKFFNDEHVLHFGVSATINGGKDGQLIKRLPPDYTTELLHRTMRPFFTGDDPWLDKAGRTIGTWIQRVPALIQQIRAAPPPLPFWGEDTSLIDADLARAKEALEHAGIPRS